MVLDLRQGRAGELLQVGIGTVLDLVLEQRGITLLIFHLPFDIVAVQCGAIFSLQRSDHGPVSAIEKCIGGAVMFFC